MPRRISSPACATAAFAPPIRFCGAVGNHPTRFSPPSIRRPTFSASPPRIPAQFPARPFSAVPFSDAHFARARANRSPRPSVYSPTVSMQLPREDFGTSAPDEISAFITANLGLGSVTSIRRAGSSGWAVMHKARTDSGQELFIKVARGDVTMFLGEALGLRAMFATQTLRVPEVFHYGELSSGKGSFIVMEGLKLTHVYEQSRLGEELARMHLAQPSHPKAQAGMFGFDVDNTIGDTPQPNGWMDNWIDFFRERRLRHQLLLTGDTDLIQLGNKLLKRLDFFFEGVGEIKPSVLHGDLWSGNVNGVEAVGPVVYDPATYYGHHEAEFGMSWCAGFSPNFWDAYHQIIPRAPGFKERKELYELYHFLNHYNLFGGTYKTQALQIMRSLLNS